MASGNSSTSLFASTSDQVKPDLDALLKKMTDILEQVKKDAITLPDRLLEPDGDKARVEYTQLLEQFKKANDEYVRAKGAQIVKVAQGTNLKKSTEYLNRVNEAVGQFKDAKEAVKIGGGRNSRSRSRKSRKQRLSTRRKVKRHQ